MAWIKACLQLAAVTAYYISSTSPNPPQSTHKSLTTSSFQKPSFDNLTVRVLVPLGKYAIVVPAIAEALIALALSYSSSPYSSKILSILGYNVLTPVPSTLYITGSILAILGGVARVQCFRALGKQFTFNIGVLKDHSLVTSGPYSWVRHPSYTFAWLQMAGIALMHAAPDSATGSGLSAGTGSWLREADALLVVRAGIVLTWGVSVAGITRMFMMRLPVEDSFLHRHFGTEWEVFAKRVKYRLIPGVY
ncbi:hypothetical protein CONPUDRAFT_113683 [Coniophora puteana RWD-64-598 SS2]|uniref:Protein-S-isoprenylcysteine O-methyltransferase n=1 Tax=Coniophora puteana (strain RWD-64-598) TaxID=741705 RepID=R7SGV7_CONPW|nr:uncharacterized protein CONPUDRAFT_113683 [Coniophora puteana RWD-64-598 SS2]EIW74279.1 hypothetical protein CONPUDRAFT_113683 [Coniophora puteana RWD-64-598 SS2]